MPKDFSEEKFQSNLGLASAGVGLLGALTKKRLTPDGRLVRDNQAVQRAGFGLIEQGLNRQQLNKKIAQSNSLSYLEDNQANANKFANNYNPATDNHLNNLLEPFGSGARINLYSDKNFVKSIKNNQRDRNFISSTIDNPNILPVDKVRSISRVTGLNITMEGDSFLLNGKKLSNDKLKDEISNFYDKQNVSYASILSGNSMTMKQNAQILNDIGGLSSIEKVNMLKFLSNTGINQNKNTDKVDYFLKNINNITDENKMNVLENMIGSGNYSLDNETGKIHLNKSKVKVLMEEAGVSNAMLNTVLQSENNDSISIDELRGNWGMYRDELFQAKKKAVTNMYVNKKLNEATLRAKIGKDGLSNLETTRKRFVDLLNQSPLAYNTDSVSSNIKKEYYKLIKDFDKVNNEKDLIIHSNRVRMFLSTMVYGDRDSFKEQVLLRRDTNGLANLVKKDVAYKGLGKRTPSKIRSFRGLGDFKNLTDTKKIKIREFR